MTYTSHRATPITYNSSYRSDIIPSCRAKRKREAGPLARRQIARGYESLRPCARPVGLYTGNRCTSIPCGGHAETVTCQRTEGVTRREMGCLYGDAQRCSEK